MKELTVIERAKNISRICRNTIKLIFKNPFKRKKINYKLEKK